MGRPLSKQQFFGANEKLNIKVQFFNGTASVPGFIVKQTGSKRFVCEDADGIRRTCLLVDRDSGDLGYKQMTITVKYDNGDIGHVTKIARHRVTVDGTIQPWTFNISTSDGRVQIEEAGTDDQLTGATDLEGDGFNFLTQYPVPGSGTYLTAASALSAVSWEEFGTPFEPAGYKTTAEVSGFIDGCRRNKAAGNFSTNGSQAASAWNYEFWDNANYVGGAEVFDKKMSFGSQMDDVTQNGGINFSLQWHGYMNLPTTQKWNFYIHSDDHFAMWVGEDANFTNPISYANRTVTSNSTQGLQHNTNSMILDSGRWYPVRFWFSEHTGACKAQVYAIGEDGTKLNGNMTAGGIQWKANLQGYY